MSARRGALQSVLRSIGMGAEKTAERVPEAPRCLICRSPLRFFTGKFGESLEQCEGSAKCPNATPHHPIPDTNRSPERVRTRRRSGAVLFPVVVWLAFGVIAGVFGGLGAAYLWLVFVLSREPRSGS